MRTPRRIALLCILAFGAVASPASAATTWNLDIHHNQTNFAPGGTGEYWFDVANVGSTDSTGTTTLKISLPPGVKRQAVTTVFDSTVLQTNWSCPGAPGDSTVICTTSNSIPRHRMSRNLILTVSVSGAEGDKFATAKVEGGGAAGPATALERTHISAIPASFGITPDTFKPDFFAADGLTTEREAGSHPDLLTVPFDLNSVDAPAEGDPAAKAAAGNLRDVTVDLPPGFVGAPTAVGECSAADFSVGRCPASSQVGRFDARIYPLIPGAHLSMTSTGVFNLEHPRGTISDLGFVVDDNPIHIKVSLDPSNHYAIRSIVSNINETLPPFDQKLTLWGVPADHSHDSERCPAFSQNFGGNTSNECATDATPKPFLSLPSQCESDNVVRLHNYDSWQESGVFGPEIDYTLPGKMTGCDRPRFEPDVEIEPTGKQANTPTGLDVHIKVPQNENPVALATPPVKRTVVTLPEGMSFSPSFADGLESCSLAQIKLGTNDAIGCPDASRIGEVILRTPLLPKPAEGSMYLAAQGDNPFGSLFAVYLVLHDTEERGVLLKIPGKIEVNESTGQIKTIFDDLPQFPFEDLTLKFRSGSRAPLVSPPSCGAQTIGVELASYAQPQSPVNVYNTYNVTEGPNGTPCPPGTDQHPFAPAFSAGTANPLAGAYSPFVFRLSRQDQEQELSSVSTVLPPGLLAKIAGISECPDAAIASISEALGTAHGEEEHPACPASSEFGTVSAGLGAGPGPNYFSGRAYLAGPYKGAPLSMAIVVPALAGPFDLGSSVVRVALYVDPTNARVTAVSDRFPTILHGVLLRIRDVRLRLNRPETSLNPTNCEPSAVEASVSGTGGAVFGALQRFQVGECARLGFGPKLSLRLSGGTHRGDHPALRATLKMPGGGANIAKASVALPHSEFLDQGSLNRVCTRPQFAAKACPAGSVYGYAVAKSPLFDFPLQGNVYLGAGYGHQLPDLVAELRGPAWMPIEIDLDGRIDTAHGGIRTNFETVPDAPVNEFTLTMRGGKRGLIENSTNLCLRTRRAVVKFTGQNGKASVARPPVKPTCKKTGKRRPGHKKGAKRIR